GEVLTDHVLLDGFQSTRTESASDRVSVQFFQRSHGVLDASQLPAGGAVGLAVVLLDVAIVSQDQLVDGQVRDRGGAEQPPADRLPLRDDAGILDPAFSRAVLSQENIAPSPEPVGQGDDGLTGLLVAAVGRDGAKRRTVGHAACPCGRVPRLEGFSGRTSYHRKVRVCRVRAGSSDKWALLDSNQ